MAKPWLVHGGMWHQVFQTNTEITEKTKTVRTLAEKSDHIPQSEKLIKKHRLSASSIYMFSITMHQADRYRETRCSSHCPSVETVCFGPTFYQRTTSDRANENFWQGRLWMVQSSRDTTFRRRCCCWFFLKCNFVNAVSTTNACQFTSTVSEWRQKTQTIIHKYYGQMPPW